MTENVLSTGEKDQAPAKEGEIKMSPFYIEGDRKGIVEKSIQVEDLTY